MQRVVRLILVAALGALPPLAGLLLGWWGTFAVLPDKGVAVAALVGLVTGLFFDAVFLRPLVAGALSAPLGMWATVYILYAVGLFGMFMAVPVFIVLLGLPAGIAFAGRLAGAGAGRAAVLREARRAATFTTAVLAVACSASAALALRDPYTAGNLEGMLGLPFQVTPTMILALILIGGAGLLITQWILTWATVRWAWARLTPAS